MGSLLSHRTCWPRHTGHAFRFVAQVLQHSVLQQLLSTVSFNVSKHTTHVNSSCSMEVRRSSGRDLAVFSSSLIFSLASLILSSAFLIFLFESLIFSSASLILSLASLSRLFAASSFGCMIEES